MERELIAGVFVALVGGAAAVLVAWGIKASRRLRGNLERAAKGRGGRLVRSFWKGDGLDLVADGVPGQLRFFMGTDKAPPWTRLRFDWLPPGRLRVAPEGFFARIRKFFGAEDLRIGDDGFDGRFLIQGSPEAWVRNVLDRETREGLTRLFGLGASWARGKGIRLDLGPAGLTLFCPRNLVWELEHLEAFLDEGLALLRRIRSRAGSEPGILSAEAVAADGRCPVCGHGLETMLRRCTSCRTLHHEDCWSYFAGCAIYGCERAGGGSPGEAVKG